MSRIETALYIVATPIGNMEDITFRAVETLKSVAFVLAEDTRVSKNLFDRYNINTPLISYRDQNHYKMIDKVVEKLTLGLPLALISDSGTPTISDPGYKLVSEIVMKGFKVITIPGPSAVIAALSISGLPTDKFHFVGFLPKSDLKRSLILQELVEQDSTIIIYESPNRVTKLLEQIEEHTGVDRLVSVVNNMTKLSEKVITGSLLEVRSQLENVISIKGEFVVLISKENKEVSI